MARLESLHVESFELEAVQFGVSRAISRYELQDIEPALHIELFKRSGEELVIQLRSYVYGKKTHGLQEIRYPATWWDAVKLRWFPAWALKRWPARWVEYRAITQDLYPQIKVLPDQRRIRWQYFEPVRLEGP